MRPASPRAITETQLEYGACEVCGNAITENEQRRLGTDIDFVEHHGHLIRRVPSEPGLREAGSLITAQPEEEAMSAADHYYVETGSGFCGDCGATRSRPHLIGRSEAAAAIISRTRGYAAKWRAEHAGAEPPVHEEPTDAALAACFAGCARPARPAEYDAIRAAIRGQR